VKAYFKEDGALAEITTALEAIFDGAPSRDIAFMMTPFLVKAYLIKRKVFERCEARERASFKEMGTNVLPAFRETYPDATQAMELHHMDEVALRSLGRN